MDRILKICFQISCLDHLLFIIGINTGIFSVVRVYKKKTIRPVETRLKSRHSTTSDAFSLSHEKSSTIFAFTFSHDKT